MVQRRHGSRHIPGGMVQVFVVEEGQLLQSGLGHIEIDGGRAPLGGGLGDQEFDDDAGGYRVDRQGLRLVRSVAQPHVAHDTLLDAADQGPGAFRKRHAQGFGQHGRDALTGRGGPLERA